MPRIQVGIRVRPLKKADDAFEGMELADKGKINLSTNETNHRFQFDNVFDDNATQQEVFQACTTPIIDSVIEGFNGCVFAFGQTGSGKTHTMSGPPVYHHDTVGLVPRTAQLIFKRVRELAQNKTEGMVSISVRLSAMEIYNEGMHDLLKEEPEGASNPEWNVTTEALHDPKLHIVESPQGIVVPALYVLPVADADEAYDLIFRALANRAVAEHQMNRRQSNTGSNVSTRSTTKGTSKSGSSRLGSLPAASDASPEVLQSKLHLVDLAGSERVEKTGSEGAVMKQAMHINKSLSFLEQVVIALSQQKRDHIPYRSSKLTHLLKDCLGGNCHTYLVACVWPHRSHLWETLSTLRFATRMKSIENHPMRNKLVNTDGKVNGALMKQVEQLKRELALRDAVCGIIGVGHTQSPLTGTGVGLPDGVPMYPRVTSNVGDDGSGSGASSTSIAPWLDGLSKKQLRDVVSRAANIAVSTPLDNSPGSVRGDDLELPLCDGDGFRSLAEIRCVMGLLRSMAHEAAGGDISVLHSAVSRVVSRALGDPEALIMPRKGESEEEDEEEEEGSAGVGGHTRGGGVKEPDMASSASPQLEENTARTLEVGPISSPSVRAEGPTSVVTGPGADLSFDEFKKGEGAVLHADYEEVVGALKNCKARLKTTVGLVNEQKASIDTKTTELEACMQACDSAEAAGGDGAVAARLDVSLAQKELDSAKRAYRDAYQELGLCKRQLTETQSLKQRALDILVKAYESRVSGDSFEGDNS